MPVEKVNGKWRYRKRIRLLDGRAINISGTPEINTRLAAEAKERNHIQYILDTNGGEKVIKNIPTFGEFVNEHIELSRVKNKPSTVETQKTFLRKISNSTLNNRRLDNISHGDIEQFLLSLSMNISSNSLNQIQIFIRSVFLRAEKNGLIPKALDVKLVKYKAPERSYLTPEQIIALYDNMNRYARMMLIIAINTGMRRGEILGLQWNDIDLDNRIINVRHNLSMGTITTPKSNKIRTIPINEELFSALMNWQIDAGSGIFVIGRVGGRLPYSSDRANAWINNACARAKIDRVGWHALRHTFASYLVRGGVNVVVVKEILGHQDIKTTMVYTHTSLPEIRRAVGQLGVVASSIAGGKSGVST